MGAQLYNAKLLSARILTPLVSGLRSVLMAAGIAVVLPMINKIGIVTTHALVALLVWIAYGYVVF